MHWALTPPPLLGDIPVRRYLGVLILDEESKGWQALFHHLEGRVRFLVLAEVGDGPGHVPRSSSLGRYLQSGGRQIIAKCTGLAGRRLTEAL